ncbi:TIGR03621 family F420-dependent LLM class oxidoreductase [Amycolatopsis alba]|uniref:LLM class F420-dependent oxidoreductase n=1 Tax=Amycolatopsis alba DSM 44262 TaxID=1125972 RepID=A0A229REW1_AMYAL|nr:TIGR03621 family F420-dependent LLM class oxidoreductase [Amycolatopsis alba]OXM45186.1 LLM class F420-dependent oxidoreductase [Amycolatopsis alba DSM 44262]
MKQFRFAVQIRNAGHGKEWRAKARRMEELGYSALLIPDHLSDHWAPLVSLTIAAEATSSLKVGSLVLSNDYRNPLLLAKEIAALDNASDGRVEFGLGAGWKKEDYDSLGIPYDPPGVRIERMTEALAIMKEFWATGAAKFDGDHYTVDARIGPPLPKSTPHPPVIIGGGSRRLLSLAAREADIVSFNARLTSGTIDLDVVKSMTAKAYAERSGWVRKAAGDRFDALELQCLVVVCQVVPDRAETFRNIAAHSPLTVEELTESPAFLVGTVDEICTSLEERRAEYGYSYWVVPEPDMERFAPVVDRLTGR